MDPSQPRRRFLVEDWKISFENDSTFGHAPEVKAIN
jgi:hypothetical protein